MSECRVFRVVCEGVGCLRMCMFTGICVGCLCVLRCLWVCGGSICVCMRGVCKR